MVLQNSIFVRRTKSIGNALSFLLGENNSAKPFIDGKIVVEHTRIYAIRYAKLLYLLAGSYLDSAFQSAFQNLTRLSHMVSVYGMLH